MAYNLEVNLSNKLFKFIEKAKEIINQLEEEKDFQVKTFQIISKTMNFFIL